MTQSGLTMEGKDEVSNEPPRREVSYSNTYLGRASAQATTCRPPHYPEEKDDSLQDQPSEA